MQSRALILLNRALEKFLDAETSAIFLTLFVSVSSLSKTVGPQNSHRFGRKTARPKSRIRGANHPRRNLRPAPLERLAPRLCQNSSTAKCRTGISLLRGTNWRICRCCDKHCVLGSMSEIRLKISDLLKSSRKVPIGRRILRRLLRMFSKIRTFVRRLVLAIDLGVNQIIWRSLEDAFVAGHDTC